MISCLHFDFFFSVLKRIVLLAGVIISNNVRAEDAHFLKEAGSEFPLRPSATVSHLDTM